MPKNSGFGAAVNYGLKNSFEKLKVICRLFFSLLIVNYPFLIILIAFQVQK